MSFKNIQMAVGIMVLSALFAGCSGGDPTDNIALPKDGTPKRKAMNEICLQTLPAAQAQSLKNSIQNSYPSDMARRDELLRLCMKNLSEGQVQIPR